MLFYRERQGKSASLHILRDEKHPRSTGSSLRRTNFLIVINIVNIYDYYPISFSGPPKDMK
jgi:hypothetical protein